MNAKFDFGPDSGKQIVYVRPVTIGELPQELRAEIEAQGLEQLYALHDAAGERLALVRDRSLAFMLARQNDLAPVSVH
ncbi:MAG: DUF1150 family protein [Rhodobacteraceae bacterium]|nr:DUF1150 family protein [Paracoccaceae bacterium]